MRKPRDTEEDKDDVREGTETYILMDIHEIARKWKHHPLEFFSALQFFLEREQSKYETVLKEKIKKLLID